MAIITKLIREMRNDELVDSEVLSDPRLIRLSVARAKSTGNLSGAIRYAVNAISKLQRAERIRKERHI